MGKTCKTWYVGYVYLPVNGLLTSPDHPLQTRGNHAAPRRNHWIYIYIFVDSHIVTVLYQISRAPGILGFLGNIGYQGQDARFGAVQAHKGRTKKLERHTLHGFALDQLP